MRARARLTSHPRRGPCTRSLARQKARAARKAERQAFSYELSCRPIHSFARSARKGPSPTQPLRTSPS
eukprot:15445837-Alexandrium_andersonii.AAC.1